MNRLIVLIATCFFCNQFSAQTVSLDENWWQPDGPVFSVVKDTTNDLVYIGGQFTSVNARAPFGTQIDLPNTTVDFEFANPNDGVQTSVPDGNGGWFIGGVFTMVGDSVRNKIAHINQFGEVTSWNPQVNGGIINTMVLSGSTLYIGGGFSSIGNQTRNNVGAIDVVSATPTTWNPNANSYVYAIAVSQSTVYLGGLFTSIGGQTRNRLASVDLTVGSTTLWNPNSNGTVTSLHLYGSKLYIGGAFTNLSSQTRNRLASFDIATGALTSWNPNPDSQVNVIKGNGDYLYIGGGFASISGQSRMRAVSFDTISGTLTPWNPNIIEVNGTGNLVNTIAVLNGEIVLGGSFRNLGNTVHNYMAVVDPITGQLSSNNLNSRNAGATITTISISGDKLYVGGYFNFIGGPARNGLAVLDASTGIVTSWDAKINNGVVSSVTLYGSKVIVGGTFTSVNSQPQNYLGSFDQATATLDNSWNPSPNISVSTVRVSDDLLFVAGGFSSIAGQVRNRLASFDLTTGTLTTWNPNLNHDVEAIEFFDNLVYVGGYFTTAGGQARNQVAAINRLTGDVTAWNPNLGGGTWVRDLLIKGSTIFIGGNFTSVNGVSRKFLAKVDRLTGIPSNWDANLYIAYNASTASDGVFSIADNNNNNLFVGGRFTGANAQGSEGFMVLNELSGQLMPTNIGLSAYEAVGEIVVDENQLYLGGNFGNIGGTPVVNFCALDVCYPSFSSIFDTASCSYSWNNSTYDQSGVYIDTLVNVNGCDSIFTLNLVIANSQSITSIQTCGSYDWTDGNVYSVSGTYTQLLTNIYGCDSLATLVLTIVTPTFGVQTQTACTNFTWPINGQTYTTSGNYVDTIPNVNGCDSIITLNLTINNSTFSSETIASCNDYLWPINNQTYTASGTYVDTIPNANGCDSIITLNLTLISPTFGSVIITSCNDYLWTISGQTYTASGAYQDTIPNANGCDSIITLNLTIVPSLPLSLNTFSLPSDANSCIGAVSISAVGEPDFTETIDGGSPITHSGYTLVENLCPGVHSLFTTNGCGDTLTSTFIIPVDSNYIFNNPFIDSIAVDSLGATIEDCDIYYNGIDTAFIDSIFANGNTVTVIWNIVDSNGSNFDTSSYLLNNGNGVYYLQLSVFCPTKSIGDYFAVTEAIYFEDGTISTAGLTLLDDDLFELFPNPTNDVVTIRFEVPNADLVVFDAQGKRIQTHKIVSGDSVSLAHLETGVYFFELTTEKGKTVKRVVKN